MLGQQPSSPTYAATTSCSHMQSIYQIDVLHWYLPMRILDRGRLVAEIIFVIPNLLRGIPEKTRVVTRGWGNTFMQNELPILPSQHCLLKGYVRDILPRLAATSHFAIPAGMLEHDALKWLDFLRLQAE